MNERGLFNDGYGGPGRTLAEVLQGKLQQTLTAIGKADADDIGSRDDVSERVETSKFAPVELHLADAEVTRREVNSGRPDKPNTGGIIATLTIPFQGHRLALGYEPSRRPDSERPEGMVGDKYVGAGYVRFEYRSETLDAAHFKAWRKDHESRLIQWVKAANKDVNDHNKSVGPAVKEAVAARKVVLKDLAAFDNEIGL